MTNPLPSDSSGQRDPRAGHEVARKIADGASRSSEHERFQRYLRQGIPVVTAAVLAIYVLMWWASNANPALRASPADQWVVGQVTGIAPSSWQIVGTGGVSSPWHPISGQPALEGPNGHPEFFYVGGEFCEFCATERWAILIALSRFGTFNGLSQLRSNDEGLATFSFYQSTFVSSYIDFVPVEHVGNTKDILGQFVPLQPFRGDEQQVFDRYASTNYLPTGSGFPFIDLNNQYLVGGGLDPSVLENAAQQPLSWREIVNALADPSSALSRRILGTANYLTAAICLVTNQQPESICQAAVIQGIESTLRPAA